MSQFKMMCTVAWTELILALRADGIDIPNAAGPESAKWIEKIVTGMLTDQTPEPPFDDWPTFDSAPKTGEFLVYMPDEKRKVQVMSRHPAVDIIGDTFAFDRKPPARWHPLPPLPKEKTP